MELPNNQEIGTSDRGPLILIVGWVECSLAFVFVFARMLTRSRLVRNVGLDDWMILLAMVKSKCCPVPPVCSLITCDLLTPLRFAQQFASVSQQLEFIVALESIMTA